MMRIGTTAKHGGFELKAQLTAALRAAGYEVADFGAHELVNRLPQYFFYAKVEKAPAGQPGGSGTQETPDPLSDGKETRAATVRPSISCLR
jgi:hypothetical protein